MKREIVAAWRDGRSYVLVERTAAGTYHAGATRRSYSLPADVRKEADLAASIDAALTFEGPKELLFPAPKPTIDAVLAALEPRHPLLTAPDAELVAAVSRLLEDPSFLKLNLTKWEVDFLASMPAVMLRWRRLTTKQRQCCRDIVEKILGGNTEA